jgi:hypothetical protein
VILGDVSVHPPPRRDFGPAAVISVNRYRSTYSYFARPPFINLVHSGLSGSYSSADAIIGSPLSARRIA